jgi:hypothetical protein
MTLTQTPIRANGNVIRGCGIARTQGAIYIECAYEPQGRALEHFLFDSPQAVTIRSRQGVEGIPDANGTTHLLDCVGETHYPYASDFLEELRLHGLSRKVAASAIVDKLSGKSTIIIAHPKAIVTNAKTLAAHIPEAAKARCATYALSFNKDTTHLTSDVACTRHSYVLAEGNDVRGNLVFRQFTKDTSYRVFPATGTFTPEFQTGLIAKLPITAITVIKHADGNHLPTLKMLRKRIKDIPIFESAV